MKGSKLLLCPLSSFPSGNIWWKTSILIHCGADPLSTGSPLLPVVHKRTHKHTGNLAGSFIVSSPFFFFFPQRTLWVAASNSQASLQMGNAPWLGCRKDIHRYYSSVLFLVLREEPTSELPPGYCMLSAPGAAHPQGSCCLLPAPIPLWYSERRSGALLYSPLQLRGIAAFQGRKSAFLIFHFTECIFVGVSKPHSWAKAVTQVLHTVSRCAAAFGAPWPLRCVPSALYAFQYHSIGRRLIVINYEGLCCQPLSSYGYISKKLWNRHFKALGRETNWLLQNSWMIITHLLIMLINNWCKIIQCSLRMRRVFKGQSCS